MKKYIFLPVFLMVCLAFNINTSFGGGQLSYCKLELFKLSTHGSFPYVLVREKTKDNYGPTDSVYAGSVKDKDECFAKGKSLLEKHSHHYSIAWTYAGAVGGKEKGHFDLASFECEEDSSKKTSTQLTSLAENNLICYAGLVSAFEASDTNSKIRSNWLSQYDPRKSGELDFNQGCFIRQAYIISSVFEDGSAKTNNWLKNECAEKVRKNIFSKYNAEVVTSGNKIAGFLYESCGSIELFKAYYAISNQGLTNDGFVYPDLN